MAAGILPFSNPAGNNQNTPQFQTQSSTGTGTGPQTNPYTATPAATGAGTVPTGAATPAATSTAQNPLITNQTDGGINALQKQLQDIYGQGVGGSLFSLLSGMGGTDSAILQQFIAGMQPQWANQRATLNTTLGEQGVSGNSTVSALANTQLTSSENAQVAQENSQLMQQQLQDTIGVLSGTENAAVQEVATSGWDVFGDVMGAIGQDAGGIMKGIASIAAL